ncbi:hypothetical protein C0993_011742 [Termitomyces sp. T159_Od127]|nr:hypothetical protein C0993_011742 [Termitomyces sp. T159_Od127]
METTIERNLLVFNMELCQHIQELVNQMAGQEDKVQAMEVEQDMAQQDQDRAVAAMNEWEVEVAGLRAQVGELEAAVAKGAPKGSKGLGVAQAAEQEAA